MREMRERSCYIMQSKMLLLLLEYFPRNWAYLFAAFLLYRQKQHANRYISFWIIFSVSRYSAAVAYLSRCNWYYCLNIKMTYWHALRGFWVSKFKSLVPCLSKKNSPKRLFYRQSCHVFLQLHFAISLCKCQMSIILLFISKMLFDLRNILCT